MLLVIDFSEWLPQFGFYDTQIKAALYTELNVIVSLQPLYDQLVQDNKVPNVFTLGLCNGMVSG